MSQNTLQNLHDFHKTHKTLQDFDSGIGPGHGKLYSLPQLGKALAAPIERLPISLRFVLESVLRNYDGKKITEEHIRQLACWEPNAMRSAEIPFLCWTGYCSSIHISNESSKAGSSRRISAFSITFKVRAW